MSEKMLMGNRASTGCAAEAQKKGSEGVGV
jgi:hypothetical protein